VDFQLNLHTESVEHVYPAVPVVVQPTTMVRQVLQTMRDEEVGSVLVCEDKRLLGIFTERDALKVLATSDRLDALVEEVMTRNPVTLRADDTVATAIRKMSFGGFRRLPVVDGVGRVVGLLRASQIIHYMVEYFPKTVYTLPPEPHPVTHEREGA
jgi:CBS domain-containing protein